MLLLVYRRHCCCGRRVCHEKLRKMRGVRDGGSKGGASSRCAFVEALLKRQAALPNATFLLTADKDTNKEHRMVTLEA